MILNTLAILVCFCTRSLGNPVIDGGIRYESSNPGIQDDMHVVVLPSKGQGYSNGLRKNVGSYRYNKRVRRASDWICCSDDLGFRATKIVTSSTTTSTPPPPQPPSTTTKTTATPTTSTPTTATPTTKPSTKTSIFIPKLPNMFKPWHLDIFKQFKNPFGR